MEFTQVRGDCEEDNCPAVYATDRGTFMVQGYVITDQGTLRELGLPPGESVVEVPADLLKGIHVHPHE